MPVYNPSSQEAEVGSFKLKASLGFIGKKKGGGEGKGKEGDAVLRQIKAVKYYSSSFELHINFLQIDTGRRVMTAALEA